MGGQVSKLSNHGSPESVHIVQNRRVKQCLRCWAEQHFVGVSRRASTPCASTMSLKAPVKRPMSRSL